MHEPHSSLINMTVCVNWKAGNEDIVIHSSMVAAKIDRQHFFMF